MKLYVQVLAIVLCSCLIQDVLSGNPPQNNPKQPPVRQPSRRRLSRSEVMSVPSKYPFIDIVKEMFWSSWEEVNKMNEFGKLGTRTVRNTIKNMLISDEFWSMLDTWVSKRTKATHDKVRADARVDFCNMLTEALSNPIMIDEFGHLAVSLYDGVIQIQSKELEHGLQVAYDIVNEKEILKFIYMVEKVVERINLNPDKLPKYFNKVKAALNIGGMTNMSDSMSSRIMKMGSTLNGQNKSLAKAYTNGSAQPKFQGSASAHL